MGHVHNRDSFGFRLVLSTNAAASTRSWEGVKLYLSLRKSETRTEMEKLSFQTREKCTLSLKGIVRQFILHGLATKVNEDVNIIKSIAKWCGTWNSLFWQFSIGWVAKRRAGMQGEAAEKLGRRKYCMRGCIPGKVTSQMKGTQSTLHYFPLAAASLCKWLKDTCITEMGLVAAPSPVFILWSCRTL